MKHRWSGWPGAWCLDCGCEDANEIALADGAGLAVEDEMSECKCEHWQVCQTCKPDMFDDSGNMLTFPPPPSKETLEAAGHRLALELECLLLDTKDLPTVSRWWESGIEALDEWRRLFPYNGPRLGD